MFVELLSENSPLDRSIGFFLYDYTLREDFRVYRSMRFNYCMKNLQYFYNLFKILILRSRVL